MTATNYEILVAFTVNNRAEVELAGTIDTADGEDTVVNIRLTESSREHLQHTALGTLEETIESLFGKLELQGHQGSFIDQLGRQLGPLNDLYKAVFETEIFLTDLVFHTGVEIRVGVMVKTDMTVGPVTCERAAVTAVYDLSAEPGSE